MKDSRNSSHSQRESLITGIRATVRDIAQGDPALEARLRADARAARVPAPEDLERRIAAAVRREAAAPRSNRSSPRFRAPLFAGLATGLCALAAIVVWQAHTVRERELAEQTADIRYLVETVQALPARIASAELPVAERLASADPLTREIASVRSDARSALDFLAANFLPTQPHSARGISNEDSSAQEI